LKLLLSEFHKIRLKLSATWKIQLSRNLALCIVNYTIMHLKQRVQCLISNANDVYHLH
jgi:hypothetical protein